MRRPSVCVTDAALAHYEALGLRLAFKMNPGQAGLWLTELRFLF